MFANIEAFAIHFLNGLTFEFGDDLFCWARQELANVPLANCQAFIVRYTTSLGDQHVNAAFAGTLVGYAVTPLSVMLAAVAGKAATAGQAFKRGFGLELIEGGLAVIGQIITDGILATALWSLGLSAFIAPIRGFIAAFTHSWLASGFFRFLMMVAILGAIAITLHLFGLLPV